MSGCEIDAVEPVVLPCLSPLGLPLPPEGHVLLKHQHGAGRRTRSSSSATAKCAAPSLTWAHTGCCLSPGTGQLVTRCPAPATVLEQPAGFGDAAVLCHSAGSASASLCHGQRQGAGLGPAAATLSKGSAPVLKISLHF